MSENIFIESYIRYNDITGPCHKQRLAALHTFNKLTANLWHAIVYTKKINDDKFSQNVTRSVFLFRTFLNINRMLLSCM